MDSMDIKVHKSRLIKYVYYLDASDLPGSFQPAVGYLIPQCIQLYSQLDPFLPSLAKVVRSKMLER